MKSHLFLLPLLALAPVAASAQSAPRRMASQPAPKISVEPAAKALLDQAKATYQKAHGLSFEVASSIDGKAVGRSSVSFQRPNLQRVRTQIASTPVVAVGDGNKVYLATGNTYGMTPTPGSEFMSYLGMAGVSSRVVESLILGQNPFESNEEPYSEKPFDEIKASVVALPARLVDGVLLNGVRSKFSFELLNGKKLQQVSSKEMTLWFGGTNALLQRVELRTTVGTDGKSSLSIDKISDQKLNPTFAADTFKFNKIGFKPASAENEPHDFDPRLQVGAAPLSFSAKTLSGQTISPAQYKGKVLLLDFWATWCGPCVGALPELQRAYAKYHAQGLEVVGVSLDEDKDALTSFIKARKMAWPQVFDGKVWKSSVPGVYGVKAIPFFLIIGKDGKIAAVDPHGNIDASVRAALAAG